ncbi:MAG: tRNA threonylcarbamoyladenosine dehydratase [Kiritimatiellia bacterium]
MSELPEALTRVVALVGTEAVQRLREKKVVVIGIGAVGGACAEALARSGIGTLHVIDGDVFERSNLNRQPFSAVSVIGHSKAEATVVRLRDIAPDCNVSGETLRVESCHAEKILARLAPDAVVDAIDDVDAKVALLTAAVRLGIPVWSAMGAARKLDPRSLRVADIAQTQVCPLAKAVRKGLREQGITSGVRSVFSVEIPLPMEKGESLGSYMPVTACAGFFLAADLLQRLFDNR